MWHDNETDVDLLGFDQQIDTVVYLIQQKTLLPLTIGVFGDWGSGKSSLMRMVNRSLEKDGEGKYVCLSFSPWQHESYDDVKTALMSSVMITLNAQQSVMDKAAKVTGSRVRKLLSKLVKRINWFKAMSFAAKGVAGAAALAHGNPIGAGLVLNSITDVLPIAKAAVGQAKEVLDEEKDDGASDEPIEQGISEFRKDFAELLESLDIEALVVFIDDLDRCLPPTIIDTLEAMRLFLAVPKTAFVLGADERIIRHAIATRYPEMPGQSVNIGRDYLEKIIQIPVRIPPLTSVETETYLNLLGCQLHLPLEISNKLVDAATENRRKTVLDVSMNYGIAQPFIGDDTEEIATYMQLISRIAPILCSGLQGNPRQTKRFMNTLLLRQRLAKTREIELDAAVLAKLMVLEYFHENSFQKLFQWQVEGQGYATLLSILEQAVQAGEDDTKSLSLKEEEKIWIQDEALKSWLRLEPSLKTINLEKYFYFSRDRILSPITTNRRLSQALQEIIGRLQSETDTQRQIGKTQALALPPEEFRSIYSVLLDYFKRDPRTNEKFWALIIELAAKQPLVVSALAQVLHQIPASELPTSFPIVLQTTFGAKSTLPPELEAILGGWADSKIATGLATSAKTVLTRRKGQ